MFLIWIGWLYVVFMISLAQSKLINGILFFVVLGLMPSLLLARFLRRKRRRKET